MSKISNSFLFPAERTLSRLELLSFSFRLFELKLVRVSILSEQFDENVGTCVGILVCARLYRNSVRRDWKKINKKDLEFDEILKI